MSKQLHKDSKEELRMMLYDIETFIDEVIGTLQDAYEDEEMVSLLRVAIKKVQKSRLLLNQLENK